MIAPSEMLNLDIYLSNWIDAVRKLNSSSKEDKKSSNFELNIAHHCLKSETFVLERVLTLAKASLHQKEQLEKNCGTGWCVKWNPKKQIWSKVYKPGRSNTKWYQYPIVWYSDFIYGSWDDKKQCWKTGA